MPKESSQAANTEAVVSGLSLTDIESVVTEIADYQFTVEQLSADIAKQYRDMDEIKASITAEYEPEITRLSDVRSKVEASLNERWALVEQWAKLNKEKHFAEPRSLKLLRATIGFRLDPPKLKTLKGFTAGMAALFLRRRKWGRTYLRPAEIDHHAILRDEARFLTLPNRLPSVGLVITRQDNFFIDVEQSGSDATGKEAR